jgi:hypothetical protein
MAPEQAAIRRGAAINRIEESIIILAALSGVMPPDIPANGDKTMKEINRLEALAELSETLLTLELAAEVNA